MEQRGRISLITCKSGFSLGERVFEKLTDIVLQRKHKVGDRDSGLTPRFIQSEEVWFANGEVKTVISTNIRGNDTYILQCVEDPLTKRTVNDNLMALLTCVDAAYQSDCENITVIVPQYPYARQERKKTRESITAKLIASFLESTQAMRVITVDVHAEAIVGFFRTIKFENLHASRIIIDHVCSNYPGSNFTVVAPDVGSATRARFFSKEFKADLAVIDKERNYSIPGTIESMRLVGSVEGSNIFMGDDIIATGSTLINGCKLLKDKGARDIYLACTFPLLNDQAIELFDRAYEDGLIKKIIGTDAIFRGYDFINKHDWYEEVSVAPLIAQVIYNINRKLSVSELLK